MTRHCHVTAPPDKTTPATANLSDTAPRRAGNTAQLPRLPRCDPLRVECRRSGEENSADQTTILQIEPGNCPPPPPPGCHGAVSARTCSACRSSSTLSFIRDRRAAATVAFRLPALAMSDGRWGGLTRAKVLDLCMCRASLQSWRRPASRYDIAVLLGRNSIGKVVNCLEMRLSHCFGNTD